MSLKTYFGIKVNDIQDSGLRDFKTWEIIHIKAYNYHEAKDDLKRMHPFEDYFVIPKTLLEHRDIVKTSKHFKGTI